MSKVYPPGPITPYGSQILMDRVDPLVTYTSPGNGIEWHIHGGLAPIPGVQEGAYLADGIKGMHPLFSQVEHKGARQDGVTNQRTVYDPAEIDMQVEFTAAPNHTNPGAAAAAIRRVIRDWMESWDPRNPGTLSYITPEYGRWWCTPRLYRAPTEPEFKAQARRLRQKYTWTVRNDDAFWRGVDSLSVLSQAQIETTQVAASNSVQEDFTVPVTGGLGPQWHQDYTGPGAGVLEVRPDVGGAVWNPSGTGSREVVNTLLGTNAVQTIATTGGVATGGTFRVALPPALGSYQTGALANNASRATVESAIAALPTVGTGNVSVYGANGGPYAVEFRNALGLQPIGRLVPTSNLTGSTPGLTVADTQTGGLGAPGSTAVTVTTGDLYQQPDTGLPGSPGLGGASQPAVTVYGWFGNDKQNGVQATVTTGGFSFLSAIIGGVTSVIKVATNIISTIANSVITLVSEVVQVAVGVVQTVVTLVVNGIKIVTGIIGALIGAAFQLIGFGLKVVGNIIGQLLPPVVTGVGAGVPVITKSGELTLTNFGDQDGYPRYLCYGPGTFRIANGPGSSQMIEFGPLVAGQIALLTTLPRLRGVVDLTPNQPSLAVTPEFDDFISRLISLAVNNNVPPLLELFQSLFGMRPPQGVMYALLKGRFTKPIPPKPAGEAPTPAKIRCDILNGGATTKVIAALTPLRRWPA